MRVREVVLTQAVGMTLLLGVPSPTSAQSPRTVLPDTSMSSILSSEASSGGVMAPSAHDVGPANGSLRVRVYMAPRGGEPALQAAVSDVSNPASPEYRKFVSPATYRSRFAPTPGEVAAVRSWLSAADLRVLAQVPGNRYVDAEGSPAAVGNAFDVSVDDVYMSGATYEAPTTDASIPAALGPDVLGVTGLDDLPSLTTPADISPPFAFEDAPPCSDYWGQLAARTERDGAALPQFNAKIPKYVTCGYTPAQLSSAYGLSATGLTGKGVTVAVVDAYASPTIESDADKYAKAVGEVPFGKGEFTQVLPSKPFRDEGACAGGVSPYLEETLDVEAVHALAPGANVEYYGARSCTNKDMVDALDQVVDDDTASIVSASWSAGNERSISPDWIAAYEQAFEQGALEGIGFFFASGDNGDVGYHGVQYPATDPYVTAVGATSTGIAADGRLDWQTAWGTDLYRLEGGQWVPMSNDPFDGGSGGGFSKKMARPAYQDGVVPADDPPGRAEPDVSMDGDPNTGMLVGETETFPGGPGFVLSRQGGTSLACPLMAAVQALASEAAGSRLGFANPTLYSLALEQKTKNPGVFRDVTGAPAPDTAIVSSYTDGLPGDGVRYSLVTFGLDKGLSAAPGWDDATGLGVPGPSYVESVAGA